MTRPARSSPPAVASAINFEVFLAARRLRRHGFEKDDVEQEFVLHWLRHGSRHDAKRWAPQTFASHVCRRRAASMAARCHHRKNGARPRLAGFRTAQDGPQRRDDSSGPSAFRWTCTPCALGGVPVRRGVDVPGYRRRPRLEWSAGRTCGNCPPAGHRHGARRSGAAARDFPGYAPPPDRAPAVHLPRGRAGQVYGHAGGGLAYGEEIPTEAPAPPGAAQGDRGAAGDCGRHRRHLRRGPRAGSRRTPDSIIVPGPPSPNEFWPNFDSASVLTSWLLQVGVGAPPAVRRFSAFTGRKRSESNEFLSLRISPGLQGRTPTGPNT